MAEAQTIETPQSAFAADASYPLGEAYDEMFAPDGTTRDHYRQLHRRIRSLSGEALADRQKTLERSFLLQGITFTVYGAESATERIIPTDLFTRIIPAAEWSVIESGLIQRLQALNLFLGDIYGQQRILADGVIPRDLVLGGRPTGGRCSICSSRTAPM